MIEVVTKGDFRNANSFLERLKEFNENSIFDEYGRLGVEALCEATPRKTGRTANSWAYEIEHSKNKTVLSWYNTNNQNGENVAILLQYGHASQAGYWIEGRDYINPAMKPVFDEIADKLWKEVNR